MGILDVLLGAGQGQQPADDDPTQAMASDTGQDFTGSIPGAGPNGGPIMQPFNVDRARLVATLAKGLAGVKGSAMPGEAFANGMGNAFGGATSYDDLMEKRKQAAAELALKAELGRGNLGVSQQNANTTLELGRGNLGVSQQNADTSRQNANTNEKYYGKTKYDFKPGTGPDEAGGEGPGAWVTNPDTGEAEFRPGMVIDGVRGAIGGAGRDFAFDHRQKAYLELHPDDKQGALDFAAGRKVIQPQDLARDAMRAAERSIQAELSNDYSKKSPLQDPAKRNEARQALAQQYIDNINRLSAGNGGAGGGPTRPPAPAPNQMTPGDGTKPADVGMPPLPPGVPPGSGFTRMNGQTFFRSPDGRVFDETGNELRE
jgi:hypothetical protein